MLKALANSDIVFGAVICLFWLASQPIVSRFDRLWVQGVTLAASIIAATLLYRWVINPAL